MPESILKKTMKWLEDKIIALDWPANSLEINPMEDVRGTIVRNIDQKHGQRIQYNLKAIFKICHLEGKECFVTWTKGSAIDYNLGKYLPFISFCFNYISSEYAIYYIVITILQCFLCLYCLLILIKSFYRKVYEWFNIIIFI